MPTLDYTVGGSATGTSVQWRDMKNTFVASIRLAVASIIAADATMTANGYIAADDIIEVMNWPSRHVPTRSGWETITAGTASVTVDIGLAGGQEIDAGVACDAAAGTLVYATVPDANIDDFFAGADTLDCEFLVANLLVGDYRLHVEGTRLEEV